MDELGALFELADSVKELDLECALTAAMLGELATSVENGTTSAAKRKASSTSWPRARTSAARCRSSASCSR